jgi:alanyl-tRNA synthetase
MRSEEIRQTFLEYFEKNGHTIAPSSPVIPARDTTLLFANAGMNQFKDVFIGREKRDYTRATTSQKCIRAGGKHNDLEQVGKTGRHNTFFEMLGNFSFGDYFKREAISYAWDILTNVYKLDKELTWVSVYKDDNEAYDIWQKEIGVPVDRIVRLGEKDNFWSMGDTGPCGPCSEILYDRGERFSCGPDCGIGNCECDRYLEIWNLVFMQFNRDGKGNMTPLPKPSIDTGMGLERLSAILQGAESIFETDLFMPIIHEVEKLSGKKYHIDERGTSFRVIADHIRSLVFALSDGAIPSNEGRGYVLRKMLRRAVRHGRKLGLQKPFLTTVLEVVTDQMSAHYPELEKSHHHNAALLKAEEEQFGKTLDLGSSMLSEIIRNTIESGKKTIDGDDAFKLSDTYGFPVDFTQYVAEEEGLSVDMNRFTQLMEEQKKRARNSWKGGEYGEENEVYHELFEEFGATTFVGYDTLDEEARVIAIISDGKKVTSAAKAEVAEIIVDMTPFYAESGGQVGDTGIFHSVDPATETATDEMLFKIKETRKTTENLYYHKGKVIAEKISVGDIVYGRVNQRDRRETEKHHTCAHLLQRALRSVLGDHVKQAGSLVAPNRTRFDFNHYQQVTAGELQQVEEIVNEAIRLDHPLSTYGLTLKEAREQDILAFFGEKYGETVRVVEIKGFSKELCGGTHTSRTGTIGIFKILRESSIAAGIRRIEACCSAASYEYFKSRETILNQAAAAIKAAPEDLVDKINKMADDRKALEKKLHDLSASAISGGDLGGKAFDIDGISVVPVNASPADGKIARSMVDKLASKHDIVVLSTAGEGKPALFIKLNKKAVDAGYSAMKLMQAINKITGGKGGGRSDSAQGGGGDGAKIDHALDQIKQMLTDIKE